MKFNEPVRPAGIGRKQVAFDVNRNPSAFTIVEDVENTQTDPQSNEAQNIATLANATAMSRAIAYSAASSAIVTNQNDIWGTQSIRNWTHVGNNTVKTQSYIKWADDVDNLSNIRSPLAYVDTEDPTIIRVKKPGWYLVNVNFFQGDHTLNNNVNELTVVSADSIDTTTAIAKTYVSGYPTINLSQLVPVPGYNTQGKAASPDNVKSQGGFQVVYTIGPHTGTLNITSVNSYASIQVVWLRPWEENFFYNGA